VPFQSEELSHKNVRVSKRVDFHKGYLSLSLSSAIRCNQQRIERSVAMVNQVAKNEGAHGEFGKAEWRTADPSTTLRFGRDDNLGWER
jgi:hypothetical protein